MEYCEKFRGIDGTILSDENKRAKIKKVLNIESTEIAKSINERSNIL